jgi:hypothetical protein
MDTWLGCNGIVSRCAFALASLFAAIGATLLVLERRADAASRSEIGASPASR